MKNVHPRRLAVQGGDRPIEHHALQQGDGIHQPDVPFIFHNNKKPSFV